MLYAVLALVCLQECDTAVILVTTEETKPYLDAYSKTQLRKSKKVDSFYLHVAFSVKEMFDHKSKCQLYSQLTVVFPSLIKSTAVLLPCCITMSHTLSFMTVVMQILMTDEQRVGEWLSQHCKMVVLFSHKLHK